MKRMPAVVCWGCGGVIDAMKGVTPEIEEQGPEPGSVSICSHCGVISIFTRDMTLRVPTTAELASMRGMLDAEMISDIDACIAAVAAYGALDGRSN